MLFINIRTFSVYYRRMKCIGKDNEREREREISVIFYNLFILLHLYIIMYLYDDNTDTTNCENICK